MESKEGCIQLNEIFRKYDQKYLVTEDIFKGYFTIKQRGNTTSTLVIITNKGKGWFVRD